MKKHITSSHHNPTNSTLEEQQMFLCIYMNVCVSVYECVQDYYGVQN